MEVHLQVDLFGIGYCPVCSVSSRIPTDLIYKCGGCGTELTVSIQTLDKIVNRQKA